MIIQFGCTRRSAVGPHGGWQTAASSGSSTPTPGLATRGTGCVGRSAPPWGRPDRSTTSRSPSTTPTTPREAGRGTTGRSEWSTTHRTPTTSVSSSSGDNLNSLWGKPEVYILVVLRTLQRLFKCRKIYRLESFHENLWCWLFQLFFNDSKESFSQILWLSFMFIMTGCP